MNVVSYQSNGKICFPTREALHYLMLMALVGWTNGECAIKSCIGVILESLHTHNSDPKQQRNWLCWLATVQRPSALSPPHLTPLYSPFQCILGTWRSNYIIVPLFRSCDLLFFLREPWLREEGIAGVFVIRTKEWAKEPVLCSRSRWSGVCCDVAWIFPRRLSMIWAKYSLHEQSGKNTMWLRSPEKNQKQDMRVWPH